jgi:hypothetical protein
VLLVTGSFEVVVITVTGGADVGCDVVWDGASEVVTAGVSEVVGLEDGVLDVGSTALDVSTTGADVVEG